MDVSNVSLSLSQLTSGMIEELDSLLHTGTEIAAIYEELTKTLPSDHLEFTTVRASSRGASSLPSQVTAML